MYSASCEEISDEVIVVEVLASKESGSKNDKSDKGDTPALIS